MVSGHLFVILGKVIGVRQRFWYLSSTQHSKEMLCCTSVDGSDSDNS